MLPEDQRRPSAAGRQARQQMHQPRSESREAVRFPCAKLQGARCCWQVQILVVMTSQVKVWMPVLWKLVQQCLVGLQTRS